MTISYALYGHDVMFLKEHSSRNQIDGCMRRLFVGGLIRQLSPFRYLVPDLLFGQDGRQVFHLKDLADFDLVVSG
ncbi:MAG: hypothetical protein ABSE44_03035, partial [Candidatus Sulfotelmatobacter sp.]